jgi:hypothetical protein
MSAELLLFLKLQKITVIDRVEGLRVDLERRFRYGAFATPSKLPSIYMISILDDAQHKVGCVIWPGED